jgi:hypothetical protein
MERYLRNTASGGGTDCEKPGEVSIPAIRCAQNCGLPSALTRMSNCSGAVRTTGRAKGRPRLRRGAYEVSNRGMPRLGYPVAKPAHAAGLLDAVFRGKAEIAINVLSHLVCVEQHCAQKGRKLLCQRGLASARQAHDQDFTPHVYSSVPVCRPLLTGTGC